MVLPEFISSAEAAAYCQYDFTRLRTHLAAGDVTAVFFTGHGIRNSIDRDFWLDPRSENVLRDGMIWPNGDAPASFAVTALASACEILFDRAQLETLKVPEVQPITDAEKESESRSRGRPKNTSFETADAPLVAQMRKLVLEGAPSPSNAAESVIGPDGSAAAGGGTPASKVRRLVNRYKDNYSD